tara:strand:+ start:7517 stop:7753 length:237 start_codon:yes stop_codon:yes gene_type:complete
MDITTVNKVNADEITVDLTTDVGGNCWMYLMGGYVSLRIQGLTVKFDTKHLPKLISEAIEAQNDASETETLSLVSSDD